MANANYNTVYQGEAAGGGKVVPVAVKEGALSRATGLRNGIVELNDRLQGLSARLDGADSASGNKPMQPFSSGMEGSLADAEAALRDCFDTLSRLSDRF